MGTGPPAPHPTQAGPVVRNCSLHGTLTLRSSFHSRKAGGDPIRAPLKALAPQNKVCESSKKPIFLVTFAFLVGKLMVGQAEPSFLKILHSKTFPSLCPLNHEPVVNRVCLCVNVGARGISSTPTPQPKVPPVLPDMARTLSTSYFTSKQ